MQVWSELEGNRAEEVPGGTACCVCLLHLYDERGGGIVGCNARFFQQRAPTMEVGHSLDVSATKQKADTAVIKL
jgi:hypothetical protein